jgi:hypothetical protein
MNRVTWSPEGRELATGGEPTRLAPPSAPVLSATYAVDLWHPTTGQAQGPLTGPTNSVWSSSGNRSSTTDPADKEPCRS